jgi:hypothetical protein
LQNSVKNETRNKAEQKEEKRRKREKGGRAPVWFLFVQGGKAFSRFCNKRFALF